MTAASSLSDFVVCVRPRVGVSQTSSRSLGALDLSAVDFAVRLAADAGVRTRAFAVGSRHSAHAVLAECSARGIDRVEWIEGDGLDDSLEVGYCLADAIRPCAPSLVLCGQRSDDGMHGLVGGSIAEQLGLPFVSSVAEFEFQEDLSAARAVQALERGARWSWTCSLPIVCSVVREITSPRYLAVRRLERALDRHLGQPLPAERATIHEVVQERFGAWVRGESASPRVRPKATKASPKGMSAADRLKLMRGGKPSSEDDRDDSGRQVSGEPIDMAREILAILEKEELI